MNLQVLRQYRAQIEEALRAELLLIRRELEEAVGARQHLEAAVDDDARRYLADAREGLVRDEAASRYAQFEDLAERIRQINEHIARTEERLEQKQAEVLAALRETKKLDFLWERHLRRQRQTQRRREQEALDESASRRFLAQFRNRGES